MTAPRRRDPLFEATALLAALTAAALGLTGEVTFLVFAVPAIALAVTVRPVERPTVGTLELLLRLVAVAFLGWFVVSFLSLRLLAGAAAVTIPVQVHSLLQPRTLESIRRLHVITFFQLVALAASTTKVLFGPLLLVHAIVLPLAVTLHALESARGEPRAPLPLTMGIVRPALLAVVLVLAGGALGFLVLPRHEAGYLQSLASTPTHVSGFSETVSLGDITRIRTSDAVVLRARLRGDDREPLRWRGITLDLFDGKAWTRTAGSGEVVRGPVAESRPAASRLVQEVRMEPMQVRALFTVDRVVTLEPRNFSTVRRDRWGNLGRSVDAAKPLEYAVVSERGPSDDQPLDAIARAAFLQLPPLDGRVGVLARQLAGEGSDLERAQRLERALQEGWSYTLAVQDAHVEHPIERFLLERSAGHCEYFATAHAVLLRSVGIPARVVNGFQSGSWSGLFRTWVVRQRDAHSWTEAWIEGQGWTALDATPPEGRPPLGVEEQEILELWNRTQMLWDDKVIGFSTSTQIGLLIGLRDRLSGLVGRAVDLPWVAVSVVTAGALGLAAVAFMLVRRIRRRRRSSRRVDWYERTARMLARRGWRRADGQTPEELARVVAAEAGEATRAGEAGEATRAGEAVLELTRLYYAERFGGRPADRRRVASLVERAARVPRRSPTRGIAHAACESASAGGDSKTP